MPDATPGPALRCAVVYNPTKVSDGFRDLVTERTSAAGWPEPLWLETSADDPGRGMTQQALDAGVDLVIAAGGDGTVRVVADIMAGRGVTMAIVPAGTGNLLARNLELPLQEAGALDVAIAGRTGAVDLVQLTVDDGRPEHFAVMAGLGVDAVIMDEVDPDLKKKVGPAAYFLGRDPAPPASGGRPAAGRRVSGPRRAAGVRRDRLGARGVPRDRAVQLRRS